MNITQKPMALSLVDKYEVQGFLGDHRFAKDEWCRQAAVELLRQHARIVELEESEIGLITERDYRDEIIDRMADVVLGTDRSEWSSSYDLIDAAQEVEDEIKRQKSELEKDAARLLYATKDYDGFVHVKRDKYEFTLECMEEAGRSEPTIEDELNGVRRLIDAAIGASTQAGKPSG